MRITQLTLSKKSILLESGTQVSGHDSLAIESSLTQDDDIDDGVLLEDGTGESAGSLIILNGTDSSSSDAGFKLLLQVDEDEVLTKPKSILNGVFRYFSKCWFNTFK